MGTNGGLDRRSRQTRKLVTAALLIAVGLVIPQLFHGVPQGGNIFRCPAWMRVAARDVNDSFDRLPAGSRGGLDIADLASWWSCAFIQTQDVGRVAADGAFEVEGRIDHSDIRGCNLLVQ